MRVRDFLVCDDVRVEVGNKHTLVGVYQDTIDFQIPIEQVNTWPKLIKLGFFIRIDLESTDAVSPDEFSFHARFDSSADSEIARGKISTPAALPFGLSIALVHGAFTIPKTSRIQFFIRLYNEGKPTIELPTGIPIAVKETPIQSPLPVVPTIGAPA